MTKPEIHTRLIIYVAAAMLTVAGSEIGNLRGADAIGWLEFLIKILLAGLITWRAFIDKSVVTDVGADAIHRAVDAAKAKAAASFKLPLGLLGVAGILTALTGCAVTLPVYKPEYGSIRIAAEYLPPEGAINLWHADAPPTLGDK